MKILKYLSMCLGLLAIIAVSSSPATAATRLTPQHLYRWADENNTARLYQFKRYINLQDNDKNTALCLAQKKQNRKAYSLLLKFGASTKVSCHDDDDPICAIIAGEKTKVSPAGLLLLGAGAAAGAYLLLDDDDGDKCKVADYPLDTCPEHGHCSTCKDKNRLDYCDEFWTPNPEHTQCIPVPCPKGEVTSCPVNEDFIISSNPTSSKSGDAQCYTCAYTCKPGEETCPTGKVCTPITAPDGTVCQQNPQCPTGYTETSQSACETANPGYYCEESAPGSGCWKKDEDNLKQCTPPAVTEGSCTAANTGFILTETPNGEKTGPNNCVTCNYACNTATGYYTSQASCETASGKTCTDVTQGGTTCWLPGANCPTTHPYTSKAACEAASDGYACVESASGSNCWGPGTTPLTCPTDHPSETACVKDDTKYVTTEDSITYGGRTCYSCAYACRPNESTCPTGKVCTPVTTPDGKTCQQNPQCDTSAGYIYSSRSDCETANPGYTCTNSGSDDCWKPGNANECPSTHPDKNKCTAGTGYIVASEDSIDWAGGKCYKCTYACDTANGYLTTCPSGKICTPVSTPAGICQTNPQCPTGYTETTKEACETANPGYYCEESALGSGCWKKDEDNLKQCTPPAVTEGNCPTAKTGFTLLETPNGEMSGTKKCVTCNYACDIAGGYYGSQSACETASGKTCTDVTQGSTTCWLPGANCPTTHPYTSKAACEAASGGYACVESATDSNCWGPGTTPLSCPTDHPRETACVKDDTKYITTEDSITYGGRTCYSCAYACRPNESTCPTGKVCTPVTMPDGKTCQQNPQCDTSAGYIYSSQSDCETANPGYTCTNSGSDDCWKPGNANECPSTHPDKNKCTAGTGYIVASEDSIDWAGGKCYKCTYACDTANGYLDDCPTGKTCTPVNTPAGTCQTNPQCPTGYDYVSQPACETANPGYTCTNSGADDCWKPDTAKQCSADYSTAYQSVNDCGAHAENGWIYTSSGTSGGLKCGKCEEKPCRNNTSTAYSSAVNCPTVNRLNKKSIGQLDDYFGETQCYQCIYTCDSNQGTYTKEDDCTDNEGSCKTVSFSTISGNVTCYVSSTSSASAANAFQSRNTTLLTRTSSGNEDVYGLSGSTETLKNTTSAITGESGRIEIAHNSTGKAYGMFAQADNSLVNDTNASIAIKNNAGGSAYGMYASKGGTAINRGSIKIDGQDGTAYGIYGEGQNTIENTGTIDVSGHNAYGIYVKDGTGTDVLNTGTITVNAANEAHGIFIDKNSADAVVSNQGTIVINGETKAGQSGITLNGAKLKNFSRMRFMGNADLNALGGDVYLEKGGTYEADTLSGNMNVGVSTVMGGNEDTYANTSALVADNIDNLNLASESALFTAETKTAADGKSHDVIMTRKNFAEFAPNASVAEYLEANYKEGYLESAFDSLKAETDNLGVSKQTANKLGYDTMLNFADENFTALKSLNRNIADTILKPTDEENRIIAGYDNINWETDGKGLLSGADLSVNSMYTFGDKRLDNYNRLGLGLSFTELSSDYDVGGDRDLNIVSIFMPYMHKFSENLRLASVLSVGYGWGEYDRGSNKESDITDIFYGLTNELRYTINLNGFADLEPALMLNALGYYEDGFDEGSDSEALETKKTHNTSVEAGIGLFLKKEMATEKYGKFGFKVGGAYYHELASPYDSISARNKGANGMWYRINDYANLYSRDRAVLEAMVDYEYKNLGVYAKYNRLLQKNDPQLFDLGIKYKF